MLYDNMDILGSWCMLNKSRILDSRGRIGSLRGLSFMREVLLREGLRFKTNLDSRRGFPTKFLEIFPRLTNMGCLTLRFEKEEAGIHLARNLLV